MGVCRAILKTGEIRDNWEPWVTDIKRGAGYVGVSPTGLQSSCGSGNLSLEGGAVNVTSWTLHNLLSCTQ